MASFFSRPALISTLCMLLSTPLSAVERRFDFELEHADVQNGKLTAACTSKMCHTLKDHIDKAENSIDFAIYGMSNQPELLDSLVAAKLRGVQIRGVVDTMNNFCGKKGKYLYSSTSLLIERLGGEKVVHCDKGTGHSYIMHNKFFIFDKKTLWTASANLSDSGIGGDYSANGAITIRSAELAAIYTKKFDLFYSGIYHRSGKSSLPQKLKWRDGTEVAAYFAPNDDVVSKAIMPVIENAQYSLNIAMFFLTHSGIAEAIVRAKKRGVDVKIILDAVGASNAYSQWRYLCQNGIAVKIENWPGKMHLKSVVADVESASESTLLFGSQNWTQAGDQNNDENTLVIRNAAAAQDATKAFQYFWKSLKNVPLCTYQVAEGNGSSQCINGNCLSQCISGSCCDGLDNDHNGSSDSEDNKCYDANP